MQNGEDASSMMVDFPLDEQEIDTLLHQTDDAENVENGFCMDQAHKARYEYDGVDIKAHGAKSSDWHT